MDMTRAPTVHCLPLTRSATALLAARGPTTIIGSRAQLATFAPHLLEHRFMTPLEVARALHAGAAPARLASFPELLGGEGPSSTWLDVDGEPCRFSTIEVRLLLGGYRVLCLAGRDLLGRSRFEDVTSLARARNDVTAALGEIVRPLRLALVSGHRDHLCPSILGRKTSEGLSIGARDHARDMISLIRMLCWTDQGIELPSRLVSGLSGIAAGSGARQ